MLSVHDVADRLGIDKRRVRGLIRARRLRALNLSPNLVCPRYSIDEADLVRFIESSRTDTGSGGPKHKNGRASRRRAPSHEALAFLDREMG